MGFIQILACLFWCAITLTDSSYYILTNAIITFGFAARTFYYFRMVYEVSELYDNTARYYQEFKYTTPIIGVPVLVNILLHYLEWGVLPVWSMLVWSICFRMNYVHAMTVKEYGNITDNESFYNPFQIVPAYEMRYKSKTSS